MLEIMMDVFRSLRFRIAWRGSFQTSLICNETCAEHGTGEHVQWDSEISDYNCGKEDRIGGQNFD